MVTVHGKGYIGGSCRGVVSGLWPAFRCRDKKGLLKWNVALRPADSEEGDDVAGRGVCLRGEMWKQGWCEFEAPMCVGSMAAVDMCCGCWVPEQEKRRDAPT